MIRRWFWWGVWVLDESLDAISGDQCLGCRLTRGRWADHDDLPTLGEEFFRRLNGDPGHPDEE